MQNLSAARLQHGPVTSGLCCLGLVASVLTSTAFADGVVLPLPPEDEKEITAHLGPGVVGKALPSESITNPALYFPLEHRDLAYLVTSGASKGTVHTLGLGRRNRPTGAQAWRFGMAPGLFGFINQTPEGHLVMPSVADSSHDVVVIPAPPNPFLPKGIKPGETQNFSQSVSVNYLDNPSKQDYSGELTGTFTYVGTYQLTVPAGTYEAVLMRTKCDGKIGPAHTSDTAYYFFAPNVGVVAMLSQEDVEAFWIVHLDTTIGHVLNSATAVAAP